MIRLSVIIPAFNAGSLLAEAVASVAAFLHDDVEVIVVDDGSTDGSAEVVATMRGVVALRQENQGPGAARNTGLAAARGEHVAFLDADDAWLPGRVDALLATGSPESQALARADLVYSDYVIRDLVRGTRRCHRCPPLVEPAACTILLHNPIGTSTVIARREAVLAAGGFRTDLRFAEDWDLWLKMAERGRVEHIANAWAEHRERKGSLAGGDFSLLHRAGEAVLEAAFERAPAVYRPVLVRARAGLDLRSGLRAYRARDFVRARDYFGRAVRGGQLRPGLKLYLASFLARSRPERRG